ncbi:MAG TPA: malto-oligosyltrehalose trehalohydrolase [Trinickia sp.]|jgi:maltooligosyltrehalose trehalohydrolase|uniref:malto-oligosyltrehalose trehalohydrolase n=1 Tax=Trinickia sp. TaxID=2571163 RepID=UPI002BABC82E|nr:malto-oligosyltrehalose trehalohydrolase [Trinickia sp.]HTI16957.1 malto-oligosyltrehalose trehalohydrolase [Trinickia sp.]
MPTHLRDHAVRHAHCLPFGAHLIDSAVCTTPCTRFRFWAPACEAVRLEIEYASSTSSIDMTATGNGWFEAEAGCGAGARYRYRLDGPDGRTVTDPASRFQPDDVHGPSEVVDPRAYTWQQRNWLGRPWAEMVIYELHVGALGGYTNVARHLPRLAALGVTAIELMPLNDFPGRRNWGYDGVLPFAPDSAYGRPEDLKALIDRAHELGLAVLLDVVYNHFGPEGNDLPIYAPAFFRNDISTPWGPAIDFRRLEVREFFSQNALYWLDEYRFDGLRFDAVHAIGDDEWLREVADRVRRAIEPGRHVHLVIENEHNTASLLGQGQFDAQWNDDAHNALHVLLTGEHEGYYRAYADKPIQQLARVLAEGFAYQGEPSPIHEGAPRGEPSKHLPPSAFVLFLQNHDQIGNRAFGERLRTLCDPHALRAATALMLLAPQIPLLFMGEECGSTQPFLYFTDYAGELADAVREGRRREFAKFSAFSDAEQRARIPDPNAVQTFALSSPACDDDNSETAAQHAVHADEGHDAWVHFYCSALAVRAKLVAPRIARACARGATVLRTRDGREANALVAHWRLADCERLVIALNLSPNALPFLEQPDGMVIFETPARSRDDVQAGALPPYTCIAWLTGNVNEYASRHDTRVHRPRENNT